MTILNEPISIWISIAALLISLSTLFLTLRKQKHDERAAPASKIAEIKTLYGEQLRIVDEVIEKDENLEDLLKKSFSRKEFNELMKRRQKDRLSLANSKLEMEEIYRKLGHENPETTDPLTLSATAVEINHLTKYLEKEKKRSENITHNIEAIIKEKTKTRKSVNRKAKRQK